MYSMEDIRCGGPVSRDVEPRRCSRSMVDTSEPSPLVAVHCASSYFRIHLRTLEICAELTLFRTYLPA